MYSLKYTKATSIYIHTTSINDNYIAHLNHDNSHQALHILYLKQTIQFHVDDLQTGSQSSCITV